MRFYALTATALLLNTAAIGQQPFTVKGKIDGLTQKYIYLSYSGADDKYVTDSSRVTAGSFSFKGNISEPTMATLYSDKNAAMMGRSQSAQLFIEPGNLTVSGNKQKLSDIKVTGSKTQDEYSELQAAQAPIFAKLNPINAAYDKANKEYIAARKAGKKSEKELEAIKEKATEAKDKSEPYYDEMAKVDMAFVRSHPASYVTTYIMRYRVSGITIQEGEEVYAKMPATLQQSAGGKEFRKELDQLKMGSPGSTAYNFSKPDINGQPLKLADFKGKYVLVDFWASWCVPCRKSNPHLKTLYAKYKDKGFEIIGISDDDRNNAAWKKAVDQDGIGIWKHVLRGLDMDKRMANLPNPDDISDQYGIHSLPTKILIDPNGIIVGRYGGGGEDDEAMDKKLASIFGAI